MDNLKDIQQFKNRLLDLADKSYNQGIFTFTSFLGLSEQDIYHSIENELRFAAPMLSGGLESVGSSSNSRICDRVVIRFGSKDELGYDVPFPIVCIHVEPLSQKFAEKLSHRDVLGALMNLGIERSTLGDILVNEKEAFVFCLDSIAEYICDSLFKIRHNDVKTSIIDINDENIVIPVEEPLVKAIQVASLRADAVISKVHNLSRDASLALFKAQKVYINGRLCENNSYKVNPSDVINARGFGKFTIGDDCHITKKGRTSLSVLIYR